MKIISLLRKQNLKSLLLPKVLRFLNIQIISREKLLKYSQDIDILYFGKKDCLPEVPTSSINIIGKLPKSIQNNSTNYLSDSPFICEVKNAKLVGQSAAAFDSNDNIIAEVNSSPLGNLKPRIYDLCDLRDPINSKFFKANHKTIELACSLVSFRSKKYFHWFIDSLTRLEGFEQYYQQTGKKPMLIVDSNLTQWQVKSLEILGYSQKDWIEWDSTMLTVDKLVIPSFRQPGNRVSPLAIQWMRRKIFNSPKLDNFFKDAKLGGLNFSEKIFISRKKASGRKISNEDEVFKYLDKFGFQRYILEDLTFQEQLVLFSQAKFVVAPHGAGLTNILFSRNKIGLIEFVNLDVTAVYFQISNILGFDYSCLECKEGNRLSLNNLKGRSDMIIDIQNLASLVEKML